MKLSFYDFLYAFKESAITLFFPLSKEERIVDELGGEFPLHINMHTIAPTSSAHVSDTKIKVTALADYADYRTSALIHTLKYNRNRKSIDMISKVLGDYILELISEHLTMYPESKIMIVPIPLSKKRKQERGFNQIEVVLAEVAKHNLELKPFIKTDILIKHKETKSQTHLNRKERLKNVNGAFAVKNKSNVKNTYILLIDDVLTTGATALETSKTLKRFGAKDVHIVTVARTL